MCLGRIDIDKYLKRKTNLKVQQFNKRCVTMVYKQTFVLFNKLNFELDFPAVPVDWVKQLILLLLEP